MLILLFLGVDKHTISKEYELTTVGLKKDHASIRDKFIKTMEIFKTKMENVEDVAQIISQGRKGWTIEEDGFQNLISSI